MFKRTYLAIACGFLAACGGGSSGSTDPPVAVNRAPIINGTPATTTQTGQSYSFTPTASDPDGQSLTFSISGKPAWASFTETTGRLSGTPTADHVGSHVGIVISVTDGTASASLPSFAINVVRAPSVAAELNWTVPTRNEDGTALTDLAGYRVRYGSSPDALNVVLDVADARSTSLAIEGLATGIWYFSIASYTSAGIESQQTGTVNVTTP